MKTFPGLLILFFPILILTGCTKEHINKVPVVDAGALQVITLPVPADSVQLSGTGSDVDGTVTAYLWSEVTGPNAAVIKNPGSPSTPVNGLIAGTYTFQLFVTDNEGATGTDTVSIQVNTIHTDSLILQPSNNSTEIHILGNDTSINESNVSSPEIGGAEWTINGVAIGMRAALQFDLSTIPATATILSAKLTLYSDPTPINGNMVNANYGTDNSFLIQQVTAPWDPATTTWVNQPTATATGEILIPSTNLSNLDLTDIDVTTMVATMVNNNSNYGFFLRLQNEVLFTSRIFCSSKYSDATKHPKLVILYKN